MMVEFDSLTGVKRQFENQELIITKTMKEGNEDGLVVRIENGRLKYLFDSKSGRPEGFLMNFYPNGMIKNLRENDIDSEGQYIEFYDTGLVKEIGYRKLGKMTGWIFRYDENGDLVSKTRYQYGERIQD
ncbi:hypothetical protein ABV409_15160 [Flagellimonas sp. DF-77]|uniref:toxin-antitoxin system YwqK family antitoxin n=1 Tax=Flagellimonas algarum TaxID=3230298 RepID=UPI00339A3C7C